mmetsp:Transcript_35444/g.140963  ORF Transcript_35444/g.140963 Transcript_35444/m.140963 type:complete len:224 (-) Transcript_35444:5844-6515(-)
MSSCDGAKWSALVSSKAWTTHLSDTDGRDKALRTVQYACKIARTHPNAGVVARFLQLESALSLARQAFRLGKWVNIISKQHKMTQDEGPLLEALAALGDLGIFCFFILDNITFCIRSGLVKGDRNRMMSRAAKCWVLSATSNLTAACLRLYRVYTEKSQDADRTRLHRKKKALLLSAIRFLCDDIVAISLSRTTPLSTGLVGACGVLSSLIQSYNLWPKRLIA